MPVNPFACPQTPYFRHNWPSGTIVRLIKPLTQRYEVDRLPRAEDDPLKSPAGDMKREETRRALDHPRSLGNWARQMGIEKGKQQDKKKIFRNAVL